ncbi:MAG: CvpA family protein [Candidatus Levybacteria bacterium]|nr:CvpA family protein [Candidatus Levybacteria bacterium]MDZ4228290.1 CvpA family protein [Candidatus Levybacteria bacterium]
MLSLNWIDYSILAVLAFYAYGGYASGFVSAISDLISFVLSFLIGLRFYGLVAGILISKFSIAQGFSNAIGFFTVTLFAEIIIGILIRNFIFFDPPILKSRNKILGICPGILSGAILISFMLILIVTLPISAPVKRSISSSRVGNFLLSNAQGWEKSINNVFGGAISETINFLTVEPKGNEIVQLNYRTKDVLPDSISEQYMFKLVNRERIARGLQEIVFDDQLRDVGRKHCKNMFERGYFSHYAPEGFSPFDRMEEAGIIYNFAGENLALSPNADIAMQGLMNSLGHRANILSVNFGRIGIGVIDGGIYGEMFCQEFTD